MNLRDFIQHKASELGFAAVGFAAAAASESYTRYQTWLQRGYAGEMHFMMRQAAARAHPARLLPSVKSLIMVAAHYAPASPASHWSGHVSARDYHSVLRAKLRQLAQAIHAREPLQSRVCVDSAPLLEREWARRAGLGWIGKQGSLVHPQYGCGLLLGALLVDLELEPSASQPNQCGDCQLCLKACPAGALRPDGLLDARRCVAYLTIEHRSAIPPSLQPALGGMLFGCDRCTAICPWNKAGELMPELRAPAWPGPAECLALTAQDFERRFAETTVHRLGLARLQRNARIALQNSAAPASPAP